MNEIQTREALINKLCKAANTWSYDLKLHFTKEEIFTILGLMGINYDR